MEPNVGPVKEPNSAYTHKIGQDREALFLVRQGISSLRGIKLSSVYSNGRFYTVETDKGTGSLTAAAPKPTWGQAFRRGLGGDWRLQLDNLHDLQQRCHHILNNITQDALNSNATPQILQNLYKEVIALQGLIERRAPDLNNLIAEFKEHPGALTKGTRPGEFENAIKEFIKNSTEDVQHALAVILGRQAQLQPAASSSSSVLVTPPIVPPPRPPSPKISPLPVPPSPAPPQGQEEPVPPIPIPPRPATPKLGGDELPRPPVPAPQPPSPRARTDTDLDVPPRPPSLAAGVQPAAAPAKPAAPDLAHYHHPYFRGLKIFATNPDYVLQESKETEDAGKKPKPGAAGIKIDEKALAQRKFLQTIYKGDAEIEIQRIHENYQHKRQAYGHVQTFLEETRLQPEPAPAPQTDGLPPPPPPGGKLPPPPPPAMKLKGPPPPPSSKLKAPPPAPGKGKLLAKPGAQDASQKRVPIKVDEDARKMLNALRIEEEFESAQAAMLQLLFPEYAGKKGIEFSSEQIEQAFKTFQEDLAAVKASPPVKAPAKALAEADVEGRVDPAVQQAIARVEAAKTAVESLQTKIRKLKATIANNDSEVSKISDQINRESRTIKGAADPRKVQADLRELDIKLRAAEEKVEKENPKLLDALAQMEKDLAKYTTMLKTLIQSSSDDPGTLLKDAAVHLKDLAEGRIVPKAPAKAKPKGGSPQTVGALTGETRAGVSKQDKASRKEDVEMEKRWGHMQNYLLKQMEREITSGNRFTSTYRLLDLREGLTATAAAALTASQREEMERALIALEKREEAIAYRDWEVAGRSFPPPKIVERFLRRHQQGAEEFAAVMMKGD